MQTTVCPGRLLQEEGGRQAQQVIDWWLLSTRFEMGQPSGPPEWPRPGGVMKQDNKLVEAVKLLRAEWQYLPRADLKKVTGRGER